MRILRDSGNGERNREKKNVVCGNESLATDINEVRDSVKAKGSVANPLRNNNKERKKKCKENSK